MLENRIPNEIGKASRGIVQTTEYEPMGAKGKAVHARFRPIRGRQSQVSAIRLWKKCSQDLDLPIWGHCCLEPSGQESLTQRVRRVEGK